MRILFAWELGAGFGHLTMILPVARILAERGAEIYLCLKSPEGAESLSGDPRFNLLQAPYHAERRVERGAAGDNPKTASFSQSLGVIGYREADTLVGLIEGWRSIFARVKPDVLAAEYSPTALLAARGQGFATAAMGTGFTLPPLTTPMPAMAYWKPHDPDELARRESEMLATINTALARLGLAPLAAIADMLRAEKQFLCAFQELDHYLDRPPSEYLGALFTTDGGAEMAWRPGATKRILAYIKPRRGKFEPILQALRALPPDHDTIGVFPELPEELRLRFEAPHLRLVTRHARLNRLLGECDLAIHHAGAGITAAMACAGVPMLMVPRHIEQSMTAQAAVRQGLGLMVAARSLGVELGPALKELLADPSYKAKARAFAQKYEGFDPVSVPERIATEIEALARR